MARPRPDFPSPEVIASAPWAPATRRRAAPRAVLPGRSRSARRCLAACGPPAPHRPARAGRSRGPHRSDRSPCEQDGTRRPSGRYHGGASSRRRRGAQCSPQMGDADLATSEEIRAMELLPSDGAYAAAISLGPAPPDRRRCPPGLAMRLAERIHARGTDRYGSPLVPHVGRVAAAVPGEARTVAWLHETLESSPASAEDLWAAGVGVEELAAIQLLTRDRGGDEATYLAH